MSVKLSILRSGETIISETKELISDDKICGYLFENPHVVKTGETLLLSEEPKMDDDTISVSLSPWIPLSSDIKIPVSPDWLVTIVEPIDSIKEIYEEKLNGQEYSMSSIEE